MAASSKCGETTTMRAKASGSTSPQVGSAKVSVTPGSYGDVVDLTRDVVTEGGQQRADHDRARDAGESAGHHRELDAGERGHGARLHVAEARPALDDRHLDGGH